MGKHFKLCLNSRRSKLGSLFWYKLDLYHGECTFEIYHIQIPVTDAATVICCVIDHVDINLATLIQHTTSVFSVDLIKAQRNCTGTLFFGVYSSTREFSVVPNEVNDCVWCDSELSYNQLSSSNAIGCCS